MIITSEIHQMSGRYRGTLTTNDGEVLAGSDFRRRIPYEIQLPA